VTLNLGAHQAVTVEPPALFSNGMGSLEVTGSNSYPLVGSVARVYKKSSNAHYAAQGEALQHETLGQNSLGSPHYYAFTSGNDVWESWYTLKNSSSVTASTDIVVYDTAGDVQSSTEVEIPPHGVECRSLLPGSVTSEGSVEITCQGVGAPQRTAAG